MTGTDRRRGAARLALAAGAGALAAFGLAPYGIWPLTLLALALLPWLLTGPARWVAALGWAFGTGYFAHALIWIVEPFLVDVERHGWMAPFALVFLAAGLALFWGAAFWAAARFAQTSLARAGMLVATWSLAEAARGTVLTGFPWAAPAQVWVGTWAAQLLAWIGPHGLTALTLAAVLLPAAARHGRQRPGRAAASLLPAAALALPALWLGQALPGEMPSTGTVRLVQPNAPQDQKWDPAMMPVFFQRLIDYTAARPHPDLIVWPETAVPTLLEYAAPTFEVMADAAGGTPMAVGIQRSEGPRSYNSLAHLDGAGRIAAIYDKHHLVPFGEYIPGGDIAARFGLRGFAAQEGDGYSAGPGPQVIAFGKLGLGLPLICYEAVFPQDSRGTAERPDFLLQITNDAWFGEFAGPYQHLAQARMRAIEQGLPMVRVANTGVSAMIDPKGRIIAEIGLGQAGFVDAPLPAPLPPTLYARTGDLPAILALLALAGGIGVTRSRAGGRV